MNLPDNDSPDLLKIIGLLIALSLTSVAGTTVDQTFSSPLSPGNPVNAIVSTATGIRVGGDFGVPNLLALSSVGNPSETGASANGAVRAMAVAGNNLYVAGSFNELNGFSAGAVSRLNVENQVDAGFQSGGANGRVEVIQPLAAGEVLVGGSFTFFGGETRPYLVRLLSDGSLDTSFTVTLSYSLAMEAGVSALAVQADGKIVVAGIFDIGGNQSKLVRLNQDGTLDASFAPRQSDYLFIKHVSVSSDSKILVAGVGNSQNEGFVQKLLPTGETDGSFAPVQTVGSVNALVELADGTIVVAGDFSTVNGSDAGQFATLNADGSVRNASELAFDGSVTGLLLVEDSIYAYGSFTSVNGFESPGVVRVQTSLTQQHTNSRGFTGILAGEQGKTYLVEASSDFINWTEHAIVTAGSTGIVVRDSEASVQTSRFFRARLLN